MAATTAAATSSSVSLVPQVIQINSTTQLPLKLNPSNFPSWLLQLETLLTNLDLMGYVNGDFPCPSAIVKTEEKGVEPNPAYLLWIRQDKLILHAIILSLSEAVVPVIALSNTSQEAMTKLVNRFSGRTRSRVMALKTKLYLVKQENKSIDEYLHNVKSLADELALAQAPVSDDDLVFVILNGLNQEFRDINMALRVRDTYISYDELHDKLTDFEAFIKRQEASPMEASFIRRNKGFESNQQRWGNTSNSINMPVCQLCDKVGHIARNCWNYIISPVQDNTEYMVQNSYPSRTQTWVMDSGVFTHTRLWRD